VFFSVVGIVGVWGVWGGGEGWSGFVGDNFVCWGGVVGEDERLRGGRDGGLGGGCLFFGVGGWFGVGGGCGVGRGLGVVILVLG